MSTYRVRFATQIELNERYEHVTFETLRDERGPLLAVPSCR